MKITCLVVLSLALPWLAHAQVASEPAIEITERGTLTTPLHDKDGKPVEAQVGIIKRIDPTHIAFTPVDVQSDRDVSRDRPTVIYSIDMTSSQLLRGNLGVLFQAGSKIDPRSVLVQAGVGMGGVQVELGYGQLELTCFYESPCSAPKSGSWQGAAFKAVALKKTRALGFGRVGDTYVGAEIEYDWLFKTTIGLLENVSTGANRKPHGPFKYLL